MKSTSIKRRRLTLVCVQCKRSKRKCDKLRPVCTRCKQSSLECTYELEAPSAKTNSKSKQGHEIDQEVKKQREKKDFIHEIMPDSCTAEIISGLSKNVLHKQIDLWNADDMLVIFGPISFLDGPFAVHSLIQYDIYSRAFSESLHGMTLVDLSYHLNNPSTQNTSQRMLSPLKFIEKAIIRRMEQVKLNQAQPAAVGMFCNMCGSEDDNLVAAVKNMVPEIEDTIMPKKDCQLLLEHFYQNIYPFYPYMDVGLFESGFDLLFVKDDEDKWRINTSGRDIRSKVETLILLMIVMSMSLRHSVLDNTVLSIVKISASESARQLSLLSHKLLCLLDVFQYLNESAFTCLLYFYVSEHLNPESGDCFLTHTNLLSLRHLTELSKTLGLQYEPSNFKRIKDPRVVRHRRMLWLGLQSLRFEVSLAEGDWDSSNIKFMEAFSENMEINNGWYDNSADAISYFNDRLSESAQNKYHLHMLLSKLVASCAPIVGRVQVSNVLENIVRSEDFMLQSFSTHLLYEAKTNTKLDTLKFVRGLSINISSVKNTEIFLANLVGHTCILNACDILSLYFESKTISSWEENEKPYVYFTFKAFKEYILLAELICDYLNGSFANGISKHYGYAIDKRVCFALVRIWIFQCRLLLRLAYKREARLSRSALNGSIKERDDFDDLLSRMTRYMRNQMAHLVDLAGSKFQENYLCSFQTIPMFRYILYVVGLGKLVSLTNDFWERAAVRGELPQSIEQKIAMKWGLDINNSKSIKQKLMCAKTLESFNESLLNDLESIVLSSKFGVECNTLMTSETFSEISDIDEGEILNSLLQNNTDFFWDFLSENLGEASF